MLLPGTDIWAGVCPCQHGFVLCTNNHILNLALGSIWIDPDYCGNPYPYVLAVLYRQTELDRLCVSRPDREHPDRGAEFQNDARNNVRRDENMASRRDQFQRVRA